MLIDVEEHNEQGIVICPNGSIGESIELCGLHVVLPAAPKDEEIAYHDLPKEEQYCGKNYPKSCCELSLWMTGWKPQKSSGRNFAHMSKWSLNVGVSAFGFSIAVFARIFRGIITCSSSGLE